MPIWENTEFRIFIVQCVVAWTTLLIAIIMCIRSSKDEKEDMHRMAAKSNMGYTGKSSGSSKHAPMLNFVTVDEIYEMSLEVLQSVPEEQMNQLPLDKKAIVKRRINELIQAERIKKNK